MTNLKIVFNYKCRSLSNCGTNKTVCRLIFVSWGGGGGEGGGLSKGVPGRGLCTGQCGGDRGEVIHWI